MRALRQRFRFMGSAERRLDLELHLDAGAEAADDADQTIPGEATQGRIADAGEVGCSDAGAGVGVGGTRSGIALALAPILAFEGRMRRVSGLGIAGIACLVVMRLLPRPNVPESSDGERAEGSREES